MNVPTEPTLVDVVDGLVDLAEKLAERNHLLDQHRDQSGAHPRFAACPSEPCRTWQQLLALHVRWQTQTGRQS